VSLNPPMAPVVSIEQETTLICQYWLVPGTEWHLSLLQWMFDVALKNTKIHKKSLFNFTFTI